ncbi:MAG: hypothetical protein Greene101449_93 [Candidatus Peregrinibacteria bacterium Greene1014_49]|nr:MAG: hypothetical protein Greene101449_93 [Candidatus Peregrinibacteria bacterium Greene1014_49]
MFDHNLTKGKALEAIGGAESGVSCHTSIDKTIIDLTRNLSAAHRECFLSQENYQRDFPRLQSLLGEFHNWFRASQPYTFLKQNLKLYGRGSEFQGQYLEQIEFLTTGFLLETLSNAMERSDTVEVSTNITQTGVLLDVNQGPHPFDKGFLEDIKAKAAVVYQRFMAGTPIDVVHAEVQQAIRRAIGYVPPNIDAKMQNLPFRGNGTTNVLNSDLFRVNYIAGASSNRTITLHTGKQLMAAWQWRKGNNTLIPHLYGPSGDVQDAQSTARPSNTAAIDALFGGGNF